jgi:uncharacterized protein
LKKEINHLAFTVASYRNEIVIVILAMLLLSLDRYHSIQSNWLSSLIYFFVIPLFVITLLLRKKPLDFGLGLGNIRIWGVYVLVTCVALLPVLYFSSRLASFQSYYKIEHFSFLSYFFKTAVYLIGWEYIFRGFLLFGLKDKFREGSILIQMVPFVLLHFGKPELETLSTILTGLYFGYLCYRGNSFWPAFLIHLFINVFFVTVINLGWSG